MHEPFPFSEARLREITRNGYPDTWDDADIDEYEAHLEWEQDRDAEDRLMGVFDVED